jgi:hypothetical protein
MQTDRQTDMTRLIIAFRRFANAPEADSKACLCTTDMWLCFIVYGMSGIPFENSKVLPVHAMQANGKSRGVVPLIFNLGTGGADCLTSRPGCFTPGKEHRYPLNRRLGEPPSRYGRWSKKENLPRPIFEPQTVNARSWSLCRLCSPVTYAILTLLEIFSLRWDIIPVMCTRISPFT